VIVSFDVASFTVPVFDWGKNQVGTVELPKHIFGVRVRPDLLHRYVVWHRANKRLGVAKVRGLLLPLESCGPSGASRDVASMFSPFFSVHANA
jgi:hypothetical protein